MGGWCWRSGSVLRLPYIFIPPFQSTSLCRTLHSQGPIWSLLWVVEEGCLFQRCKAETAEDVCQIPAYSGDSHHAPTGTLHLPPPSFPQSLFSSPIPPSYCQSLEANILFSFRAWILLFFISIIFSVTRRHFWQASLPFPPPPLILCMFS